MNKIKKTKRLLCLWEREIKMRIRKEKEREIRNRKRMKSKNEEVRDYKEEEWRNLTDNWMIGKIRNEK